METEDRIKEYKGYFIEKLNKADCTNEDCDKLWKEIKAQDGFFELVNSIYDKNESDLTPLNEYVKVCIILASKYGELGNKENALKVIADAKEYTGSDELKEELDGLEDYINNQAEERIVMSDTTKVESSEGDHVIEPKEKASGSNKMLMYGAVAAVVIAAVGFFAFGGKKDKTTPPSPPVSKTEGAVQPSAPKVQKVLITYDLPEGTQITLDGKDISGSTDAEVTVGKHSLELKHALLDLDYDKNLNVSNAGKIALVKEFKLGANVKAAAENTVKDMLSDILQQACTSESMVMSASLYTPMADKNERITKAHNAMRNYAMKNSLKSMPVENINLGELELINKDGGKSFYIKGAAELLGVAGKGKKLNYTVQTTLKIEKNALLVDSLDAFKAQIAK